MPVLPDEQSAGGECSDPEVVPLGVFLPVEHRDHQVQGSTSTAIATIQQDISGIVPYTMEGKQSATTTVKQRNGLTRDFVTTDNMHSEMVALQHMLTAGEWRLSLGLVQWAHNGNAVDGSEFSTTAPHCGFCTVILEVLGLPLTSPTKGNYNLSCNFNYPLPDRVQNESGRTRHPASVTVRPATGRFVPRASSAAPPCALDD